MATQPNKNDHIVVSVFPNRDKAKEAQKGIEKWDDAEPNVKLGASAIIFKGDDGKVTYQRSGKFNWKSGALIGLLLVPLTGGILLPAFGAAAGFISTWIKGIKKEDVDQISSQIQQGHAALAVLCDDFEMQAVSNELMRLGGSTIVGYTVPANTATQAEQTIQGAVDQGHVNPQSL